MTAPEILAAVEAAVRAADFSYPVRFANQSAGWGWLGDTAVELPVGPGAEWAEVSMPRLDGEQVTSSPAALVGNERPRPLLYVHYYGPEGVGAARGLGVVHEVGALFSGQRIGDAAGGVDFFQGVSSQQLATGPAGQQSGLYYQVQGWLMGLLLYKEAA